MDYDLIHLLKKLGVPEVAEDGAVRWHYMEASDPEIGGFADARLEARGRILTVELRHMRKFYEDDNGLIHASYTEEFLLKARRLGTSNMYRVMLVAFDGNDYDPADTAMIELGCSIFHSRALEISTIMTERAFGAVSEEYEAGGEDDPAEILRKRFEASHSSTKNTDESWGVVVPFRPRKDAPLQRI